MIKKHIEEYCNTKLSDNKGYKYITTETVAVPIHKVTLGISKRHITNLELVEEIILKLVSIGLSDIETISRVLGLPRDIVDITIGDLHLKNLAFHSSGNCILMGYGREALKSLSTSNRQKDILRDVYVNAVTGAIYGEKNKGYVDNYFNNESKVHHLIDANDINHYRKNTESIREIFEKSTKTTIGEYMQAQDELVSVDSIEDITTGFILVPINLYVSESGYDIDITAKDKTQKQFFESHKETIIDQMRAKKLFPKLTVNTAKRLSIVVPTDLMTCKKQIESIEMLKKGLTEEEYEDAVFSLLNRPRILFDNELLSFCSLLFKDAKKVEFFIDDLISWSYDSKLLTLGSLIGKKTDCSIIYKTSPPDNTKAKKRVLYSCPNIKNIEKGQHDSWLCIVVDGKLYIETYSEAVKVFSDNRYILKIGAYIKTY